MRRLSTETAASRGYTYNSSGWGPMEGAGEKNTQIRLFETHESKEIEQTARS